MDIAHTSKISTLEVAVSQQIIQIKKLEKHVQELQVAGRAERDNAQEGWDLANSYKVQIEEFQKRIDELEYKNTGEVLMEANIPLEDEVMTKEDSLVNVRLKYSQEWDSEVDIPYADSIYKMIDNVIEYQLDNIAEMELEDFYRYHMRKHYEDKRNAIEFNDAWVVMHGIDDR